MRHALKLFEQLDITYNSCSETRRGPMSTCCGKFVQRLIRKHGLPHATIVLRTIVESEGNQAELIADVIGAISDIVRVHPRRVGLGLQWLEAFDAIDPAEVRKTAKTTGVQPLRDAIMTIVCLKLEEIFGPSKLPKVKPEPQRPMSEARIPQVRASIELGLQLLALRKKAKLNNRAFGQMVRAKGLDTKHASDVSGMMRVARVYSDRPEIFKRLSWNALFELSSPKMSPAVRQALEAKVIPGEPVTAPQIRKARGRLRGGSLKRKPDQPASRMSA